MNMEAYTDEFHGGDNRPFADGGGSFGAGVSEARSPLQWWVGGLHWEWAGSHDERRGSDHSIDAAPSEPV
jgi:hypothetical protein